MNITPDTGKQKPFTCRAELGKKSLAMIAATCCMYLAVPASGAAQTIVRDVDAPARQPFQSQLANQVLSESQPIPFVLASVPLGKRLVVEHVSLRVVVPSTMQKQSLVQAHLQTQLDGQTVDHVLVLDKVRELGASKAEVFEVSQPIRAYADAGTNASVLIVFDAEEPGVTEAIVNRLSLSGHFVDLAP